MNWIAAVMATDECIIDHSNFSDMAWILAFIDSQLFIPMQCAIVITEIAGIDLSIILAFSD